MNKIETLRAAFGAAAPKATWVYDPRDASVVYVSGRRVLAADLGKIDDCTSKGEFIALAHNLMPSLIEAVDALEAMRCSGGSVEFQANFDWAKSVLEKLK